MLIALMIYSTNARLVSRLQPPVGLRCVCEQDRHVCCSAEWLQRDLRFNAENVATNSPDLDRGGRTLSEQGAGGEHKFTVILKENSRWPVDFEPPHAIELDFIPVEQALNAVDAGDLFSKLPTLQQGEQRTHSGQERILKG